MPTLEQRTKDPETVGRATASPLLAGSMSKRSGGKTQGWRKRRLRSTREKMLLDTVLRET